MSANESLAYGLVLSALLVMVAVAAFGEIADQVTDAEGLTAFDNALARWLHSHMGSGVTALMVRASALHSTPAVSLYVAAFAVVLTAQRNWYRLRLLVAVIPAGMLLNVLLKHIFRRARPAFDDMTDQLTTFSFPSGHTMAATVLWGFIVMWAWPHMKGWPTRALLVLLAGIAVLLVGFSRIYLGAHFMSDVLAAMCEGIAWTTLCGIVFGIWRRKRGAAEP
ncbi:MAG: phosphatase PAP2 family protein [Ramlibacter sp.]|nr:phosphatase PAP2 family protein [Ramlibacter sp.]